MAAKKGNKNAVGNEGGREPHYSDPNELQAKIDDYFEYVQGEKRQQKTEDGEIVDTWIRHPEPITITGLALHLGFSSRQSMYDYQDRIEFSYIIRRARTRVENGYEKDLRSKNARGAEFALKNMGWADKVESVNKNTNINHNSVPMSNEEIKDIAKALEDEY